MNRRSIIRVVLTLTVLAYCLFEFCLDRYVDAVREFVTVFLSFQWVALMGLVIWCFILLCLTRQIANWLLVLFLSLAIFWESFTQLPEANILVLVFGIVFGKWISFVFLKGTQDFGQKKIEIESFLAGLILFLTFSAWLHLDMTSNYYHGPRWMGLWDNPNTYGMLMGTGCVLAGGMLTERLKVKGESIKWQTIMCCMAMFVTGVGLVMSYSRGAWLGSAIGLSYLAWAYGKLKWHYTLLVMILMGMVVCYLWGTTTDSAAWYIKRADLGRPSAQNRVTAWQVGFKIMRDHPLGLGWNKVVDLYGRDYSPPGGDPGAITTNDYLMIGTELGTPALICFLIYMTLRYRKSPKIVPISTDTFLISQHERLRAVCLAGALVLIVAFWFDGGLFKLPTASVFWVLLELACDKKI